MNIIKQRSSALSQCAGLVSGVSLLLTTSSVVAQGEPPMSEEAFWEDVPMIMSATRLSQPVVDAPVAVTVIDREMIEASGARQVAELMRLVPGFTVGYQDGNTASVSNHFALDHHARRMQVLVDGRSVYVTAIGGVPWVDIPLTIDDIERIEVVRGPNSSSYGANSYLGVISIITRHSSLDQGASVKINMGDEGVREGFVRYGDSHRSMDYRVNMSFIEDDGLRVREDDKKISSLAFKGDITLSNDSSMTVQAGLNSSLQGKDNPYDAFVKPRTQDVLSHFQQIDWEKELGVGNGVAISFYHIYHRTQDAFTGPAVVNPNMDLLGFIGKIEFDPVFFDMSIKTERFNLEVEHTTLLTDQVRVAWGVGARQDTASAATYLGSGGAEIGNHLNYSFANAEWNINKRWLMNAGLMVEDYHTTGTDASPRLGVNYKLSDSQSFRLTSSKAIRTPSIFEYAGDWSQSTQADFSVGGIQLVSDYPIFNQTYLNTQTVRPEKIHSVELGFNSSPIDSKFSYDVRIYRDRLNDMIAKQSVPFADITFDHWAFFNLDSIAIRGLEFETDYRPNSSTRVVFSYAYGEVQVYKNNYKFDYAQMVPQNSFNVLLIKDFPKGYNLSTAYYFTDEMQGWASREIRDHVRRLDVTVGRDLQLYGYDTEWKLALRNVLGEYEEMELIRPKTNYPYINETDPSVYASLKVFLE